MDVKRARLIEENIPYEKLALERICSEDEINLGYAKEINAHRKDQKLLKKAKFLSQQIKDIKRFSMVGMQSILDTIKSLDKNSMEIVYKHFDKKKVNLFRKDAPNIINGI